ncbi:LOW QUALITY PROTEIN: inner centromere protein [Telopea speciosissima]|uniref:LOW QUALITY PROTEIN: inner centromere protein n=1 Tax=Telopea speciosissima TaxID=54955 RepID=UPI001CC7D79F|nr:LOW QUALITY PROTEIN: inner centromere protein [Telopea speciosissima]
MALSSAFQERLLQMEETRNQRLSLLQAEKELQSKKSLLLESKFSNIRYMEQRCLILEQKNAALNFKILGHRSEISRLEAKYQSTFQQLRDLKSEVEELEDCEKEKDRFYVMKRCDMEDFKGQVKRFVLESRQQVQDRRRRLDELKSSLQELQGNNGVLVNSEIAAAEKKKAELLAFKENWQRRLASNYQLKAQLQKQLQNILLSQQQERRKLKQSSENEKSKTEGIQKER